MVERGRALQPAAIDSVAERREQRFGRDRLLEQIEDTRAQTFDRGLQLRVRGHHHHLGAHAGVPRSANHFATVQVGHLHVEEHDVHVSLLEPPDALAAARGFTHVITRMRELVADDGSEVVVVVDHQYAGRRRHP